MPALIFFYLVLPFLLFGLLLRFLRKYGGSRVSPEARALCAADPLEPGRFRAARARRTPGATATLKKLEDFETQDEAVDAAYGGKASDPGGTYLVLNEKGETLREI